MRSLRLAVAAAASIALWACGSSTPTPTQPSVPLSTAPASTSGSGSITRVTVNGIPPGYGSSSQFTALAVMADGSTQVVTSQASWTSSAPSVAAVSSTGLVTINGLGSVVISATYAGLQGTLGFTVGGAVITYTISGTVTDSSTRGPVSALVTVRQGRATASAPTDAAGRYSITGLSNSYLTEVSAVADGYVSVTRTISFSSDTTLDFPLTRTATGGLVVIGFDDARAGAFTSYSTQGVTVTASTPNWTVSDTYGHPAPFVQFRSDAGTTTTGEIVVTIAGGRFRFQSMDVYSSVTPIPYVVAGLTGSATAFTLEQTQPNTFGSFVTVANPSPTIEIDTLRIRLSNTMPPVCCGSNPMGVDNITIRIPPW